MNHSGDAAEQMVRISLEGVEVAAKITGTAAKEIAVMLIAALKSKDKNLKLKGRARLASMLKSGNALEIFSVKESDLKQFMQGAKQYGIVYCVLRGTKKSPDGLCDVMVKADDAPKINRLVERFNFAAVEKAKVESEIVAEKAKKSPDAGETEKLLDDFSVSESKAEKEKAAKETGGKRPLAAGGSVPPKTHPFEPISGNKRKSEKAITNKPSVKQALSEIKSAMAFASKQQNIGNRTKSKKTKERF